MRSTDEARNSVSAACTAPVAAIWRSAATADPLPPTTATNPNQPGNRRLALTAMPKQANAAPKNTSMPMLQMPNWTWLTAMERRSARAASAAGAPTDERASAFPTNPSTAVLTVTTAPPSRAAARPNPASAPPTVSFNSSASPTRPPMIRRMATMTARWTPTQAPFWAIVWTVAAGSGLAVWGCRAFPTKPMTAPATSRAPDILCRTSGGGWADMSTP